MEDSVVKDSISELSSLDMRYCWGWSDTMEAANDIYNSLHSNLLAGEFVFGYKNVTGMKKSDLAQLIVVRFRKGCENLGTIGDPVDTFGVGVITTGYSMLLPKVPLEYLETELVSDLEKWKIETNILNTFKRLLANIRDEITCN